MLAWVAVVAGGAGGVLATAVAVWAIRRVMSARGGAGPASDSSPDHDRGPGAARPSRDHFRKRNGNSS